jgi:hypothetical protein
VSEQEPRPGHGPAPTPGPKRLIQEWVELRQIRVEGFQLDGLSVRRIAELVGVDVATAHRDIKAIRERRRAEVGEAGVREHRDLTLMRLEQQRSRVLRDMEDWPADPDRDIPARPARLTTWQGNRLLLQIEKQRADLLGLNAPAKVQLQEFAADDDAHESMDEAPKERTLEDLVGDPSVAGELAKVLHLADRAAG